MLFEWDEDKRRQNLRKHGIDFIDVQAIWSDAVLEYSSDQTHHDEERYLAIGELHGQCIAVIYTWRGDTRRLISARKARRYEQKNYQDEIG
jgi:uncharacterized DUF497 family protein